MTEDSNTNRLLVSGDFSGIQDTVYTISSKGALKTLRARSFSLELLNEHIIYELLKLAHMSTQYDGIFDKADFPTGVVYSGGGSFCLILLNRQGLLQEISDFIDAINEWAIGEFSGKLYVAVDQIEVAAQDLEVGFAALRKRQAQNLERIKRLKFMTADGSLLRGLLTPAMPHQMTNEQTCQITGRDDLPDDQMKKLPNGDAASQLSFHLWHLGEQLSKLTSGSHIYRYRFDGAAADGALLFPSPTSGQRGLVLYSLIKAKNDCEKEWTVGQDFFYAYYNRQVKDLPEGQQKAEFEAIRDERPNASEKDILEYTASLAGLASCAVGADLIGALRMDVDDLGRLFNAIDDYRELARRSRQMNFFFKSMLNDICAGKINRLTAGYQQAFPLFPGEQVKHLWLPTRLDRDTSKSSRNVSVVYAGGDDLFIVGAWDDVLELSFDIQQCFCAYCKACGIRNPENDIHGSISAGLTIHPPKFPLYQMARRSGEAETEAKAGRDSSDIYRQKNRFAIFHDASKELRRQKMAIEDNEHRYALSMRWEATGEFLLPLMRDLVLLGTYQSQKNGRRVFELDHISRRSIEKWFRVIERYHNAGELYLPTMARVMAGLKSQLIGSQGDADGMTVFANLMKSLYKLDNDNMAYVHLALNWLSYLGRAT